MSPFCPSGLVNHYRNHILISSEVLSYDFRRYSKFYMLHVAHREKSSWLWIVRSKYGDSLLMEWVRDVVSSDWNSFDNFIPFFPTSSVVTILWTVGAHFVPYSCLLISNKFCNGGERPEQCEQVPLCTCSSTPLSMSPETSFVGSCA